LGVRRFQFSRRFERMFRRLQKEIQEAVYQKLALWEQDPFHPSLRIKPIKGHPGIWEMSVTFFLSVSFDTTPLPPSPLIKGDKGGCIRGTFLFKRKVWLLLNIRLQILSC
jgi:hypothetical protein